MCRTLTQSPGTGQRGGWNLVLAPVYMVYIFLLDTIVIDPLLPKIGYTSFTLPLTTLIVAAWVEVSRTMSDIKLHVKSTDTTVAIFLFIFTSRTFFSVQRPPPHIILAAVTSAVLTSRYTV
jgi:hypothetical protein